MFNPFKKLELIKTEVFMSMPAKFRKKQRSAWSDPNRQGAEVECFLEGPSFDREGNLWFVDIPFGRIFRITPKGDWELVTQYDGWPNGLKIHKDGRIFICDYKEGLLMLDPKTGKLETVLRTAFSEGFKGLNDLHFAANGDLYFTDQGQTGIADPSGRVFRLRAERRARPPVRQRAEPQRHHALDHRQALLRRRHALAADLAPADHGRRLDLQDRRGDPALRRRRRARRHRDGFGERPAGVPARCGRLALRQQHAADAPDAFGQTTSTTTSPTSPSAAPTARRSTSPNRCRATF